jgi:REP element-mobilizing transposase RayT
MPRRGPIDPQGYYHIGSRGNYGQPLFRSTDQYELFLKLYGRSATKYSWETLTWVLMPNHHHFIIKLTEGGLSEGLRELHGGFSRRIHAMYGMTGQGHLIRHAFFGRELRTEGEILVACRYVDLNEPTATGGRPESARWCGYRATVGLERPRPFHNPEALLGLISPSPNAGRAAYRRFVHEGLASQRRDPSPNDGLGSVKRSMVESTS